MTRWFLGGCRHLVVILRIKARCDYSELDIFEAKGQNPFKRLV